MKKRVLLSLLMLLCFMLTACGSTEVGKNNADEQKEDTVTEELIQTEETTQTEEPEINFENVKVGLDITFGTYNDKPIEWQVLAIEDGKALLITKGCLLKKSYNARSSNGEIPVVTWETCELRAYLNGEFYENSFNNAEKTKIVTTAVVNNDNPKYDTVGGNNTEDVVFILSIDEANTYFDSDDARIAKLGEKDYDWWLRSPGYNEKRAACVYYNGSVNPSGGTFVDGNGVRPVCWVNIE